MRDGENTASRNLVIQIDDQTDWGRQRSQVPPTVASENRRLSETLMMTQGQNVGVLRTPYFNTSENVYQVSALPAKLPSAKLVRD